MKLSEKANISGRGQGGLYDCRVGVEARKDLEKLFGRKVHLGSAGARSASGDDANEIKRPGYPTGGLSCAWKKDAS